MSVVARVSMTLWNDLRRTLRDGANRHSEREGERLLSDARDCFELERRERVLNRRQVGDSSLLGR
jgi:hypothetical protein